MDGRIANSKRYGYEVKYPILLGKHHPYTELLIHEFHEQSKHLGISTTIAKIRMAGFWIPQARQAVKKMLSKCTICKRYNSLAFKYPSLTNLPKHHVNLVNSYENAGIDYTGHLWVNRNRKAEKMCLLIIICLAIRSIHIEIVQNMSTKAFIQAFIRFCNSYGLPSYIFSDNVRSLDNTPGIDIIEHHLDSNEFRNNFISHTIYHIKIPLYSPRMGSIWERMIKTTKTCLFKTLGRAKSDYFQLLTMISDIQRAINSRPLMHWSTSDTDVLSVWHPMSFYFQMLMGTFPWKWILVDVLTGNLFPGLYY